MGIIRRDDLIAWADVGGNIFCTSCGDPGESKPLTKGELKPLTRGGLKPLTKGGLKPLITEDFDEGDIVSCDDCGAKIL